MSNRRSLFSMVAAIACLGLAFTASFGDDLTGKHKSGGGEQRGGGGGGSNNGGDHQRGGGGGNSGGGSNNGGDHQRGGGSGNGGGGSSSGGDRQRGGGGTGTNTGGQGSGGSNNGGDHQRGGGGSEGGRRGGGSDGGSRDRDRGDRDRGSSSGGGGNGTGGNSTGGTWPGRSSGGSGGSSETRNGGGFNTGQGSDLLGKRGSSRSGDPQYGSNSNSRSRDRNSGPLSIGRAPTDVIRGSLGNQVRRSDVIRVGGTTIRFGYTHYDYRWRDDYFFYSHYVFDPFAYPSYCSPWYYYPQLPPYFLASRCVVLQGYVWSPFMGVNYVYYPSPNYDNGYNNYSNYNNDRRRSDLDYSLDDIANAFNNDDRRAVSRLVPRSGRVNILIDGKYAYSMNADDFYDTLVDATENSKTTNYKILDVQTNRDGAAVWARHDFEDPWGRRQSVYHYFRLEQEGRDWVIREFGTSENRW